jgi:hypothetical protein
MYFLHFGTAGYKTYMNQLPHLNVSKPTPMITIIIKERIITRFSFIVVKQPGTQRVK